MEFESGVAIDLISIEKLESLDPAEKVRFILEEIRRGKVLVLERGLTATEEADLIKTTMSEIDQDTFIGIEMQSYSSEDVKRGSWLSKLLKRSSPPRMSVVGPADLLKTVNKDGSMIQAMILTRESIVNGQGGDKGTAPGEIGGTGPAETERQDMSKDSGPGADESPQGEDARGGERGREG